jgi:putative peptidoglycan lipid II flippase
LRRRGQFELDPLFRRRFAPLVLSTLLMGAAIWAVMLWLGPAFAPASGLLLQLGALTMLVTTGLAVYTAGAQALGAFDFLPFLRKLRL